MLHYRNIKHYTSSFSLLFAYKPPYSECYDRATRATPVFNVCGHGWHARMACHPKACHVPDALNPTRTTKLQHALSLHFKISARDNLLQFTNTTTTSLEVLQKPERSKFWVVRLLRNISNFNLCLKGVFRILAAKMMTTSLPFHCLGKFSTTPDPPRNTQASCLWNI